eukprot:6195421-Pleurochrysis_carterae.AAC.1
MGQMTKQRHTHAGTQCITSLIPKCPWRQNSPKYTKQKPLQNPCTNLDVSTSQAEDSAAQRERERQTDRVIEKERPSRLDRIYQRLRCAHSVLKARLSPCVYARVRAWAFSLQRFCVRVRVRARVLMHACSCTRPLERASVSACATARARACVCVRTLALAPHARCHALVGSRMLAGPPMRACVRRRARACVRVRACA